MFIFFNENIWIAFKISVKFVPKARVNSIRALVQIMPWHCPGDKPLSEPTMVSLPTQICVTWPQWVNISMSTLWCHPIKLGSFHGWQIIESNLKFMNSLISNNCIWLLYHPWSGWLAKKLIFIYAVNEMGTFVTIKQCTTLVGIPWNRLEKSHQFLIHIITYNTNYLILTYMYKTWIEIVPKF